MAFLHLPRSDSLRAAGAGAGAAAAADNPFLGTWTITEERTGPWVKPGEQALPVEEGMLHATVTFTATSVTGPRALACPQGALSK